MAGAQMRGSAQLDSLKKRLKYAQTDGFKRVLLKNLAQEGLYQVAQSFQGQRDPYGKKWKALSHPSAKRSGGQILSDTGRLRNSFSASSNSYTFTIRSRVQYAAIHQYGGTTHAAARTALQKYKITGRDRRTRVKLNSRARRIVTKAVEYSASSSTIPARPYLPESGRLGARWTLAFAQISTAVLARVLATGGKK